MNTTVNNCKVLISWNAPTSIKTAFSVEVESELGVFHQVDTYCEPAALDATRCVLGQERLFVEPFSLKKGDMVIARVTAVNSVGRSLPSLPNNSGGRLGNEVSQITNLKITR